MLQEKWKHTSIVLEKLWYDCVYALRTSVMFGRISLRPLSRRSQSETDVWDSFVGCDMVDFRGDSTRSDCLVAVRVTTATRYSEFQFSRSELLK